MRYSVLRGVTINVLLNSAVCRVVVSVSGSEPVFISVSYYRSFLLSPSLKVSTLKNEEFIVTNVYSMILSYDMCVYCD